ncbi:MAG TPA: ATP-binding protein [Gammaproteobacteria bacterium]|nr:ATP-binding protein [Gammaproteobacteria bacterium]
MKFVGREKELYDLNQLYQARESKLAVIYGRRRVGKSCLVDRFMQDKKHLRFEGLEQNRTRAQIAQLVLDLSEQTGDALLKQVKLDSWEPVLDYLTRLFSQTTDKYILFLDEFQWLAVNQTRLVSLLKKYWDQNWSKQNVMLVLCGSVCSYMTKRVISSKALYGRINWELCLKPLNPVESYQLLNEKRNTDEVLQYLQILGGIPKYLKEVDTRKSFNQNINNMLFTESGVLANDYSKIFYSQFKEYKTYENIVRYLRDQPRTLDEIALKLKIPSGGGAKSYLENLEKALFITSYVPYNKKANSKLKKYKLTDEYLRFYFKYVEPYEKLISANQTRNLFDQLVKPAWNSWLGFAFENYCLNNAMYLAKIMGFEDRVVQWGPYFQRGDEGFQIDLVYLRSDRVVTLCEIKYYDKEVPVTVVHEVEKKCSLIELPRGYTLEKALISRFGPERAVVDLDYFHHYVQGADFFSVSARSL